MRRSEAQHGTARAHAGRRDGELGAASVEYAAVGLLVALALAAALTVLGMGPRAGDGSLAATIAFKQRCAVRFPDPCWQDPLTEAYGRAVAGAVRALAPAPRALAGPGGTGLVGVDYRRCRQVSCATPLPGAAGLHLTASNRRTAAFTALADRRRAGGDVRIDYWIYRPTIGWELVRRRADAATIERYARTPLPDSADPKLIPLETLLGRDEAPFRAGEEPPWRGRIESRWGRN